MDLVATTDTLVRTLPAAGHGLASAAMAVVQAQHDSDFSLSGIASNPKLYGIMTVLLPLLVALDRKIGISDALARLVARIAANPPSLPPPAPKS